MKSILVAAVATLISTSAFAQDVRVRSNSESNASANSLSQSQSISQGNRTTFNERLQAPGIGIAGLAASGGCLGSASGGISGAGFGVAFGSTVPDNDCRRREQARVLYAIGGAKARTAALYLLSLDPETFQAMSAAGMIVSRSTPAAYEAAPPALRRGRTVNGVEQIYNR